MKAVIIPSGDGTRLRPLTCSLPHCMLPIMGRPLIEHTIRLLARHNITNVVIASSYLPKETEKHFSAFSADNVHIEFTDEHAPGLFASDDDVLLISDSILCDTDFGEMISVHTHSGSDVTILAKHTDEHYKYGTVCIGHEGFVTSYNRFPDFSQLSEISFMGIAVIKKGIQFSDCKDLPSLIEFLTGNGASVYCYTTKSYVKDISDFENYRRCCRDFMDKKIKLSFPCQEKAPSVWVEDDAVVMQGAILTPPVYIGKRSLINKGARIDSYTQICSDTTIDCYSSIKRSIVMDNSHICENVSLRGAIIGKNCTVGYESAAYEGSVLGFGSKTGRHCTIRTSVHIWPDKFIADETSIRENIVWEDSSRPLFVRKASVSGILNRDITPEFATRLARAVTNLFGKKIAVSCEGGGAGSMIRNAIVAGIQSGGGKAFDMGEQPLPITRSGVRFYSLDGGIALSVYTAESALQASLDIISSGGTSPDKETINSLNRILNDFSDHKVLSHNIQESEYLFEYKLYYLKKLINSTSKKSLGAKILIHTTSSWAKELLFSAAADLKCEFSFSENSDITSFSKEVSDGDYHLGAYCDTKCETLSLVTTDGVILSEYEYTALTSLIIMKQFENAHIYVLESAPDSINILAQKYNAEIHRMEIGSPSLMTELSKSDSMQFLHQFIYQFDAVGAIIILLDYLCTNNTSLKALLREIPGSKIVTDTVSCHKNKQKDILKRLCQKTNAVSAKTENAVKLDFKDGWVIVVPESDNSCIKIISHAMSAEYAHEIADICVDEIVK